MMFLQRLITFTRSVSAKWTLGLGREIQSRRPENEPANQPGFCARAALAPLSADTVLPFAGFASTLRRRKAQSRSSRDSFLLLLLKKQEGGLGAGAGSPDQSMGEGRTRGPRGAMSCPRPAATRVVGQIAAQWREEERASKLAGEVKSVSIAVKQGRRGKW